MRQSSLLQLFRPGTAAHGSKQAPAVPQPTKLAEPAARANDGERGAQAPALLDVGTRLKVYWADDDAWYNGTVRAHVERKHKVVYDDGDIELLDLSEEKYKVLPSVQRKPRAAHEALEEGLEDSDVEVAKSTLDSDSEDEAAELGRAGAGRTPCKRKRDERSAPTLPNKSSHAMPVPDAAAENRTPNLRRAGTDSTPGACKSRPADKSPSLNLVQTPSLGNAARASDAARLTSGRSAAASATPGQLMDALTPSNDASGAGAPTPSVRFSGRYEEQKFSFIWPSRIRDARQHRPDHPEYDPSTVHVPQDWFKQYKVSDGQRQWWEFKAKHWDSVMLFKTGKFYEMYEMDAFVGVDTLGLVFMKGDQPHAGFPEAAYFTMSERLARAGHRVVVVEQTETPAQLKAANDSAGKGQKRKVVRREAVAVLSKGTLTDACMLEGVPQATYVAALVEGAPGSNGCPALAVCLAEVSAGEIYLGSFSDTRLRAKLQRVCTEFSISEFVIPRGTDLISPETKQMLKGLVPGARMNVQRPAVWSADCVRSIIEQSSLREHEVLAKLLQGPEETLALQALAGMVGFLTAAMLDAALLSVGRLQELRMDDSTQQNAAGASEATEKDAPAGSVMVLDAAALSNLEVLQTGDGTTRGSLLEHLDHCVTPMGKRLLRAWISRPLQCAADIHARQDAVEALQGEAMPAMEEALSALRGCKDLERTVMRLATTSVGVLGRDAPHVILFEDTSKRKISALTRALKDLRAVEAAADAFKGLVLTSTVLKGLVSWGERLPDFRAKLTDMELLTDWPKAELEGQLEPKKGVDDVYDQAVQALDEADKQLEGFRREVCAAVGVPPKSSSVAFVSLNKDSHVIEVPENLARKVPRDYHAVAGRKGFKRYSCEELQELVEARSEALGALEAAQMSIFQRFVQRFADNRDQWLQASAVCAELDVLMALARAALLGSDGGPMCRPRVLPYSEQSRPYFKALGLRHAAQIKLSQAGSFVPNSVDLGADEAPFMLLTGPNTGGKSTLMRQVCLAAILAQIGAWVPAEQLTLTPADAIFVRMGARDHIMLGQSTFYVEMSETAAMLAAATKRSIVALDELGRGTATMDGTAIAGAVLDRVTRHIGCRGIFATHYHVLADQHADNPGTSVKHMACGVTSSCGGVPRVIFKFTLTDGACPKSYGPSVARAAGIPEELAVRAMEISEQFQHEHRKHGTQGSSPAVEDLGTVWKALEDKGSLEPFRAWSRARRSVR